MNKRTAYKFELRKHLYFKRTTSCTGLGIIINNSLLFTSKFLNEFIDERSVIETCIINSTGGCSMQINSLRPDLHFEVSVRKDQLITRTKIVNDSKIKISTLSQKMDLTTAAALLIENYSNIHTGVVY